MNQSNQASLLKTTKEGARIHLFNLQKKCGISNPAGKAYENELTRIRIKFTFISNGSPLSWFWVDNSVEWATDLLFVAIEWAKE